MTLRIIIGSIIISYILFSCSTISTNTYFQLKENQIEKYNWFFIKDPNDTNYQLIEKLFGSISDKDTVIDKKEIIHKTFDIDGYKAFYALEVTDSLLTNPSIGPNYFLASALIFFKDTIFVAPAYSKKDLEAMRFSDFKTKIPPFVKKKDSIIINDGERTLVMRNFSKTNLNLNNRNFKDCLAFEVIHKWPDTIYSSKVWLGKEVGLLKWVRTTGRIDTREL